MGAPLPAEGGLKRAGALSAGRSLLHDLLCHTHLTDYGGAGEIHTVLLRTTVSTAEYYTDVCTDAYISIFCIFRHIYIQYFPDYKAYLKAYNFLKKNPVRTKSENSSKIGHLWNVRLIIWCTL